MAGRERRSRRRRRRSSSVPVTTAPQWSRTVVDGLGQVRDRDFVRVLQVGDGAADAQHAGESPGGESQLLTARSRNPCSSSVRLQYFSSRA